MADDGLPADEGLWDDDEDEDEDFQASDEGSDGSGGSDDGDSEEEEKPKKKKGATPKAKAKAAKKAKKAKSKPKRKRRSEMVEEEAEDDDEDDSDGGGGGGGSSRGKRRKRGGIGAQFIDEMAAVDDEDEEEEAEDDVEELINDKDEELGPDELEAGQAAATYRAVTRQADDRTEEELAKYIEERYKGMAEEDDYEGGDFEGDALTQEALLPTAHDPKLWVVQCRPGHEREAVMQLLQKAYTMQTREVPLAIRSAFCHDHLKGYFYIEADKESHVLDAIKGLRTMFFSKGAKLVPTKEMPDALTVPRSSRAMEIARDAWVRVKNGLYKDDLGKILDVDYATSKAVVQLVPRLDLKAIKARQDGTGDGGAAGRGNFGRAPVVRPPPRAFSTTDARAQGLQVLQDRFEPGVVVLNSHRFKGGYTLRSMALKSLVRVEAPPMDELAAYQAAGGGGGRDEHLDSMSEIAAALPEAAARRAVFVPGDRVVVVAGDLINLEAVVTRVEDGEGGLVHVRSVGGDGVEELELPMAPSEIAKAFRIGDHVRVLSGTHKGETGMVVRVDRGVCAVVGDATRAQFRVNARDLTEAKDKDQGLEVLGDKYQLHDLVQLDAGTAGVIISVERGAARVLTNMGSAAAPDVRICKVSDITRKIVNSRLTTVDRNGAAVGVGEAVEVMDGDLKGKKGTVHAVVRGHVFLRLPDAPDKSLGGFVCVKSRSCATRAGQQAAAAAGAAGADQQQQQDRGAQPGGFSGRGAGPGGGFGGGSGGGGRGRGRGHQSGMMGMEIKVQSGPYKGYKGRVLQETPSHLRLELDAINRIVTVERRHAQGSQAGGMGRGFAPGGVGRGFQGPGMGRGFAPGELAAPGAAPRTPGLPMQTPLHPSMTPRHPSMTPLHPGVTPSTPGHPSFGLRTPAHPSQEDLGYGNYGGGGGYGGFAAPTPGGGGFGGGYAAPTPGTAETPGAFGDLAPTPGIAATPGLDNAYPSAPTPGGGLSAPTPGGGGYYAPTPGGPMAGPAPTPGGGGVAYTPGFGGAPTPGGPGMVAATPGGMVAPTPGLPDHSMQHPGDAGAAGAGAAADADAPDYVGVLVHLPGGGLGVGARWIAAREQLEAVPESGGAPIIVEVVQLVKPHRQDAVKVVGGPNKGATGRLISIEGADAVLHDGTLAELSFIGKLAEQPSG